MTDLPINTIIQGDCLDVMRGWPDKCVDLVLTDPPYGLGNRMNGGTWGATKGINMEWDKDVNQNAIQEVLRVSKQQIIWGGNYYQLPLTRCWLAWYKRDFMPTTSAFELAWTSYGKPTRLFNYPTAAVNKERNGHPTQKPLALFKWCLENYSEPDWIICDPFLGSGTTAVACKELGRNYIGIELNPDYIKIAERRLRQEVLAL